jgi:hypothetical protein
MDTLIVAMRCGQSGRPFRVAFDAARLGAPYRVSAIAEGSGITVSLGGGGEPRLASGGATATLDESVANADDLEWGGLVCPFCHIHAPPARCVSCGTLLCLSAALPEDRRLSFLCPVCGWKQKPGRPRFLPIGWLRIGRFRTQKPLRIEAHEMTALPAAHGLLGTAKRLLLPGPKRRDK